MSVIQGQIDSPDLKFVQLKSYKLAESPFSGSGQCLAVDQNSQTIFVCCNNELIYVPLLSLLSFDHLVKEFLKNVDKNVPDKVVVKLFDNPVDSNLLSISGKGFGSKLAVACSNSNQASFILFYDLKSLLSDKEKCIAYNHWNFSVKGSEPVRVRMLEWHPEMNDNVFACSLTDGSIHILYVSDGDKRIATELSSLSQNVTSFCWSPKGKQIVVGFDTGKFSQFKIQINDKCLVQNTPFTLAKSIDLPPDFATFKIGNICWLSTFNFIVVCHKSDDVRYLLVSIPSAKATGAAAVMRVVDFGCINIESVKNGFPFEVDFMHLDNLLFTYTNKSFNFALLGCQSVAEVGSSDKWFEMALEDDNGLMVPLITGTEFIPSRGITVTRGTHRTFKSGTMDKGGPNRHFALVYDLHANLTLFLVDFDDPKSETILNIPKPPASVLKPVVQSIAPVANNPVPKPPPVQSNQIKQSSVTFAQATATVAPPISKPATVEAKQAMPEANEANQSTIGDSTNPEQKKRKEADLSKLYVEEILANIKEFQAEIESFIKNQKAQHSSSIGSSEEFERIHCDSEQSKQILEEVRAEYVNLNSDVNNLHSSFLELRYLLEETQSLLGRNTDPKYRNLLRQRHLDPITTRRVADIVKLTDYIDVQLRELDAKFDLEWQEFLHEKKLSKVASPLALSHKAYRKRSTPTSPFNSFIESRDEKKRDKYSAKIIFQAVTNNQRLIENLQKQLNSFGAQVKPPKDMVNSITELMNDCTLNRKHVLQCLPEKQNNSLRVFLQNRHSVPIRECGPCISETDCTRKSRFLSVLEKLKSKESKKSTAYAKAEKKLEDKKAVAAAAAAAAATAAAGKTKPASSDQAVTSLTTAAYKVSSVSGPKPVTVADTTVVTSGSKKEEPPTPSVKGQPKPVFEDVSPPNTPGKEIPSFTFKISPKSTTNSVKVNPSTVEKVESKPVAAAVVKPPATTTTFGSSFGFSKFTGFGQATQAATVVTTAGVSSFSAAPSATVTPPASLFSQPQTTVAKSEPPKVETSKPIFTNTEPKVTTTTTKSTSQPDPPKTLFPFTTNQPTFSASLFTKPAITTTTATTTVASVSSFTSFSFGGSLGNSSSSGTGSAESTPATTTTGPVVSLFTSPAQSKPEVATLVTSATTSSTASLFGTTSAASSFSFSTNSGSKPFELNTPASSSVGFSFNNTLSSFSASSSNSSTTPSQSTGSLFGSNSTSSFGQSLALSTSKTATAAVVATTSSAIFGNPSSPLTGNLESSLGSFKICDPQSGKPPSSSSVSTSNLFGSFSFGGSKPQSSGEANSLFANSGSTTLGFFNQTTSTAPVQSPSLFGNILAGNSGTVASPAVSQPVFGASPPPIFGQSSAFNNQPASAFGSPPTFGSAPKFGSSPVFGQTGLSPISSSFMNSDHTIGAAFKDNPLSFDTLAKQDTTSSGFANSGSGFGSPTGSGLFFNNNFPQNNDAFTQRRN